MILPKTLILVIESSLGQVVEAMPVGGGDISQAVRVRLAHGSQALIKWRSNSLPGLFTAERRGLELLRSAGTLRVPEVLAQSEAAADCPGFIAIEWLDPGSKSTPSAETLGVGLAALHHVTAAYFGLDYDNFIGANPQP